MNFLQFLFFFKFYHWERICFLFTRSISLPRSILFRESFINVEQFLFLKKPFYSSFLGRFFLHDPKVSIHQLDGAMTI